MARIAPWRGRLDPTILPAQPNFAKVNTPETSTPPLPLLRRWRLKPRPRTTKEYDALLNRMDEVRDAALIRYLRDHDELEE
ncbi:MAG: hypothetical protein ABI353_08405 [Isosphaeraceae bacterium]